MSTKLNILFLSSWFPTKYMLTIGNFVKSYAHVLAQVHQIRIIYAQKVDVLDTEFQLEQTKEDNLELSIMYFRASDTGLLFIDKILNSFRHFRAYKKMYLLSDVKPDLVHANVVWPIGLFAYYLKFKYGLKYILTEHWSLLSTKGSFGFWKKMWILKIFRHSSVIIPVSEDLKNSIQKWDPNLNFKIIPNVVNTEFFNYQIKSESEIFRWAHVSTLAQVKNVEGIIRAFSKLLSFDKNNKLTIISDGDYSELQELIKKKNISDDYIKLVGTSTNEDVADLLKASDACVQFSISETFGIVAAESLCCGTPLVSTKVGFLKEYAEQEIGLFVENKNEEDLFLKMRTLKSMEFDALNMSLKFSNLYGPERIQKDYTQIYKKWCS